MTIETALGGQSPLQIARLPNRREDPVTTPAGLQDKRVLARRRRFMIALNLLTVAVLTWGIWHVFSPGGMSVADWLILLGFLVGAPWTVMGMWNAIVGLWLIHGARDGLAAVAPQLTSGNGAGPIRSRVAVAMCFRNEPPARSFERLLAMRESLDATGWGDRFDIHILSDTSDQDIASEEERLFAALGPRLGTGARYRRRVLNTGFKAGNIRDFVTTAGLPYDLFIPLDSDSLMGGEAMIRMVRIMEAHPRIGILQSLVVGSPSQSAFARIFQFGMRHGMRSFTMGAAWWQGDCGPFWGHNAAIRMDAFRRHCRLPVLPGTPPLGGHVLSHDQVEAALMRRAGYEVRVIPVEGASWEDNPPTLADFTKRDLRWCQGNMQYFKLLRLKGLRPTSLFQLIAAIAMYFGGPAWMLMTVAASSKLFFPDEGVNVAMGIAMFFIMISVSLVPKLAGLLDIALKRGGARAYGGRIRFALGAATEIVFSMLTAPVVALRVTIFMAGLLFGKRVVWSGQNRDAYRLSWAEAAQGLWPQTLFGLALGGAILAIAGMETLAWAAPMVAGMGLAIPFAVLTADPRFGRWAARTGLCAVPEEVARHPELARVARLKPVVDQAGRAAAAA
ncbi:MAG: glucans biosynthesis glucosyltransferase MdoH [Pikeienuella sp.]